jgi:nucleoside-diphosphate-sugar epimerase
MKILVTGTEGYIGVLLAPILQQRGHSVSGFDTGYYRSGLLYGEECMRLLFAGGAESTRFEDNNH